ncbi:SpaH/EbpB family LPXTG-anchored major pilin [Gardnerella sp. DNF00571G]|uniref:SpaH/EbpB family LPXTG-anchored major pilin n=1 Tax=Gardnerella sp. DNF00571G TaxID=2749052 RepID=UPI003BB19C5E
MRLKTNSLKRTVAVLAAVCTLGTCCVAGSVAYAGNDGAGTVVDAGANTADISSTCGAAGNKTNCTSITIHKYNSPSLTATAFKPNGTDMSAAIKNEGVNKPLKGVEFTLYKVQKDGKDIDLSKPEGWKSIEDLKDLTKGNAASFFTAPQGKTAKFTKVKLGDAKETNENGVASFTDLSESLYYVEETSTAKAQMDYATEEGKHDWKPITVTVKTDPFFVTTPLSHKTDDSWEWLYNVHVFPKNDVNKETPAKTAGDPTKYYIDDNGNTVIPWKISIPLSAPSEGKTYKKIGFVDSLPAGLKYSSVTNVMLVKVQKKADEGKQPTSVDIPLSPKNGTQEGNYEAKNDNGKVTFNLTAAGLKKIDDIDNYTYTLKVTLNTGVTKGTKNFTNFITGWIDDSKIGDGDENNPCVPTEQNPCDDNPHGSSHFATLKITKVAINAKKKKDEQLTNQTLKGAEFAVYSMKDQSAELTGVTTDKLDKVMKDSNTQLTMVTGEDGTASVDLFIANDNKTQSRKYCLVETKAPAGFKKDETPHCYAVNVETKDNVGQDGVVASNSQKIGNDQATELDKILDALPMTGARGLVLLTAFGIVGLGGTLFYIITRRRKEQEEA